MTSPAIIFKDLVIIGSSVSETLPAAPGDIRAYDVHTGKLRWSFHTIPHPGEPGYETWPKDAWTYTGGVNNWSGMSLDVNRGLVFVPTGSAAYDFYGANRLGDNLFANSLIALNAQTGERVALPDRETRIWIAISPHLRASSRSCATATGLMLWRNRQSRVRFPL